MSFDLFGFDFIRSDSIYGFWVGSVNTWDGTERSLICAHYSEGEFRFEFLYIKVI